jgi:hypothetical protein
MYWMLRPRKSRPIFNGGIRPMLASGSPDEPTTPSTVSERKRQANAANARRSTGPNTEGGKRRSAQNATKHGGYASTPTPIHRGAFAEDPTELRKYIDDIVTAHSPRDAIERAHAKRIAICCVRGERISRYEAELLSAPRPEELADDDPDGAGDRLGHWRRVQRWLTTGDVCGVNFDLLASDLIFLATTTNRFSSILRVPAEVANRSERDTCEAYLDALFPNRVVAADWVAKQTEQAKSDILQREGAVARSAEHFLAELDKIEIMRQRIARELERAQLQYDALQRRTLRKATKETASRNEPTEGTSRNEPTDEPATD